MTTQNTTVTTLENLAALAPCPSMPDLPSALAQAIHTATDAANATFLPARVRYTVHIRPIKGRTSISHEIDLRLPTAAKRKPKNGNSAVTWKPVEDATGKGDTPPPAEPAFSGTE